MNLNLNLNEFKLSRIREIFIAERYGITWALVPYHRALDTAAACEILCRPGVYLNIKNTEHSHRKLAYAGMSFTSTLDEAVKVSTNRGMGWDYTFIITNEMLSRWYAMYLEAEWFRRLSNIREIDRIYSLINPGGAPKYPRKDRMPEEYNKFILDRILDVGNDIFSLMLNQPEIFTNEIPFVKTGKEFTRFYQNPDNKNGVIIKGIWQSENKVILYEGSQLMNTLSPAFMKTNLARGAGNLINLRSTLDLEIGRVASQLRSRTIPLAPTSASSLVMGQCCAKQYDLIKVVF